MPTGLMDLRRVTDHPGAAVDSFLTIDAKVMTKSTGGPLSRALLRNSLFTQRVLFADTTPLPLPTDRFNKISERMSSTNVLTTK